MSKRNVTLLIIIVAIIVIITLGFFAFYKPAGTQTNGTAGNNFFSTFFPSVKKTTGTPTPPTNISGYVPPATTTASTAVLKKISSFPVAGFGVFQQERFKQIPTVVPTTSTQNTAATTITGTSTTPTQPASTKPISPLTEIVPAVRYVNKATGNIFETFADQLNERQFSTTIVPEIYEADFGNNAQSVIMRYLKNENIETFVGSLPQEILGGDSANNQVQGTFLPENVSDIAVSPDTINLFYLFNSSEGTVGIMSDSLGNNKTQIFDSPYSEWLSQWPNARMITLTTKPSAAVPGYMYAIDPIKPGTSQILGGINGLTTLTSPSGKLVLYANNNLTLNIYSTDSGNSTLLGIKTLPDKCVWNQSSTSIYCAVPKSLSGGNYPDDWYQGEISFADDIWKIDVATGNGTLLADPAQIAKEDVDGIQLALDSTEHYLFFINKKDSYLWELSIQ